MIHVPRVEPVPGAKALRAACSCGWTGVWRWCTAPTPERAVEAAMVAASEHAEEQTRAA